MDGSNLSGGGAGVSIIGVAGGCVGIAIGWFTDANPMTTGILFVAGAGLAGWYAYKKLLA